MRTLEVTRLPHVDEALFRREYYGARPLLLPAFVRDSRACRLWSPEYLDSAVGGKTVQVNYCARELEKTEEGAVAAVSQHFDAPFSRASELIRGSSEVVYFLMGQPIRQVLPELLDDLDFDELILRFAPLVSANLWFAAAGHSTPLHYDAYDNFLNQIAGRKKVTLYSPSDQKYLYPPPVGAAPARGAANLSGPEHDLFPDFRRATPAELILEPGDTLYVPPGWSHLVESLDVTVSVNIFYVSKGTTGE